MTENEALEILKKRNIHRGQYTDHLLLDGEVIGEISNGYVYLADYIPSVIGEIYQTVAATAVVLSNPDAPAVLDSLIDMLEDTAERYAEETRKRRVNQVRKYFQDRKYAETILNQSSFDYTKLTDQSTTEKL